MPQGGLRKVVVCGRTPIPRHSCGGHSLLPDTHAHLDAPVFDADREAVIARAAEAGVFRILTVGTNLASSRRAVEIAHAHPSVYAAVGIDPHEAGRFREEEAEALTLLNEEKVVAVGEVGLDYTRSGVPREAQLHAFRAQLRWAAERELPVSVHSRGAEADVAEELKTAGVTVILHCFSGDATLLRAARGQGWYCSFAGNVTFKTASDLRAAAAAVPLSQLLIESDAPVLAPQPVRGRRNEPSYVRFTAQALASAHGTSEQEMSAILSGNAERLFRWGTA